MMSPLVAKSMVGLAALATFSIPARLSDPVGVFAVIDRVVAEPNATNPERVQLWGVFALADKRDRNSYLPAERGYLYLRVNPSNPRVTQAEWSDLKGLAGTHQPVGFGARFEMNVRVRDAAERPEQPDIHPIGFGLVKVMTGGARPPIAEELVRVPLPVAPAYGANVAAGAVRLIARSVPDPTVRYVFEIEAAEGPDKTRETSQPIAANQNQAVWTPNLRLKSGATYTWRVWTVNDAWRGRPASVTFRTAGPAR